MVNILVKTKRAKKMEIFFIGVGGSAGNATQAVNDFRKIASGEWTSAVHPREFRVLLRGTDAERRVGGL